jgi:hypothetical protein
MHVSAYLISFGWIIRRSTVFCFHRCFGSVAAPEEAQVRAPVESMSRAEPAAAGAVDSFVLDSFQYPLTMEVMMDPIHDCRRPDVTSERKWRNGFGALGTRTSTLTGEELSSTNHCPNIPLHKAIRERFH